MAAAGPALAQADITIGVTVSATGPAASLGIPERNTIALMPRTIAGGKVNCIVPDDASDTTAAVANTRKLITERRVGVVIGSTTTPNPLATIDVVSEAQVLKLIGAKPDAVLIAGSGTPAALPQKALRERGYTGPIYQTHGVANADFLRVGGKDVEGTFLPSGPVLVADELPANHPVRKSAQAYVALYEQAHGKGSVSTFGAHASDAGLLVAAAVPEALKTAQPGPARCPSIVGDTVGRLCAHCASGRSIRPWRRATPRPQPTSSG